MVLQKALLCGPMALQTGRLLFRPPPTPALVSSPPNPGPCFVPPQPRPFPPHGGWKGGEVGVETGFKIDKMRFNNI